MRVGGGEGGWGGVPACRGLDARAGAPRPPLTGKRVVEVEQPRTVVLNFQGVATHKRVVCLGHL